jgi:hypothetical protein
MADLDLVKKSGLKVKIYGVEYVLSKPKVSQVEEMAERLEKKESAPGGDIKLLREFVHKCGVPNEVISEMDAEDFNTLAEFIVSSGKKKSVKNG